MGISDFLTSAYWLEATPPYTTKMYLPLSILFGLMLVLAVAILVFAKGESRKILTKYCWPLLVSGALGPIYLGARYEQLPYLSARIVLALVLAISFVWIIKLLIWSVKNVSVEAMKKELDDKYNKYLPSKKNKK